MPLEILPFVKIQNLGPPTWKFLKNKKQDTRAGPGCINFDFHGEISPCRINHVLWSHENQIHK